MKARLLRSAWIPFILLLAAAPLQAAEMYVEEFDDEADGPPEDWYVYWQTAVIDMGWLSIYPTGQEPFVYAGRNGQPIYFNNLKRIKFTVDFFGVPGDGVGRHGGIVFCCNEPTQRYGASFRGYMVDWIDRVDDHGYRIIRMMDGGNHYLLSPSVGSDQPDPGSEWEFHIDDGGFRLTVDGVDLGYFADTVIPHSGYVGFWCYTNANQNLLFDDVEIESSECPNIAPAALTAEPGETVSLTVQIPPAKNATASYDVTVKTSDAGVAVPVGAAGDSLTITFPADGELSQSFGVQCKAAGKADLCLVTTAAACGTACTTVTVSGDYVPYEEHFTGKPDGPSEDWVVATADGNVRSEEYELMTMGGEPTAYIGIAGQPLFFHDVKKVQFRIRFGDQIEPGIGAHGGIIFNAQNAGATRYGSPNYVFDWLARDFTYRLYRTVGGAQVFWPSVIPDSRLVSEYWRIEFAGATIRVFATDDELDFYQPVNTADYPPVFEVNDSTHRSGYIGFWGYSNAGQQIFIDDVLVKFRAPTCPGIAPASQSVWLDDPNAPIPLATISIPFGANAAADYAVTVTSSDPNVARPAGAAGASLVLTFKKGDPLTQEIEIQPVGAGTARFSLTVPGAQCPDAVANVEVKQVVPSFCDTFTQADGPPEKWTIYAGDGSVGAAGAADVAGGEMLVTRFVGGETWVWANGPDGKPGRFGAVETISLNVDLTTRTPDAVGRHGGIMFFANAPTQRWATSGYELDWIDRTTDRGYRFIRSDNGGHTLIAGPTFDLFPEPAAEWKLEIDDEAIRFYADDELVFEVFDSTYRGGYFGLWTYSGGTEMRVDDVAIGTTIDQCGRPDRFIRGSADGDASLTIGDPIFTLNYIFASGTKPPCVKAADFDDSGDLTIGDPIGALNFLFVPGSTPPKPPSPGCGTDPTNDPLTCESFPGCP